LAGSVAGLLAFGWHVRSRLAQADADRLALDQARQDLVDLSMRLKDAEALGKADAESAVRFAGKAAELERQADQLRQAVFVAVQRGELVTTPEATPDAPCPAPVLSPRFRVLFNAAASGDLEAIAALEAGSGDAAGGTAVPAAGLVRPSVAP
jgi:hypothetical protein